jgi:hypothetical protein
MLCAEAARGPKEDAMRRTAFIAAALFGFSAYAPAPKSFAAAIPTNFAEYGTSVNGYQDQFTGTALDPGWTLVGGATVSVSGGYLHVSGATTDPSKLLYTGGTYDGVTQNVLALIKVVSTSGGSDSRVGVSASNTTAGQGMNVMFRGAPSYSNVAFLNDFIAHGPQNTYTWQTDTFYWMRILHSMNKTGSDPLFNGANDVFAKVWPADGTTVEPAYYQWAWASNDSRSGFAGIQTGSNFATATFDVGYVLIQAAGLPTINVGPVAPPTPPNAPTNLVANYAAGSGVTLTWTDNSADETAFQIDRAAAAFPFSALATKPANATTHVDTLLYPSVTYTYRVRSQNANGNSAWSNEASITTDAAELPPEPPKTPSGLTASALGSDSVALAWQDNSADEVGFEILRATGGTGLQSLFGVKPDVVSFADHAVHPGWPNTYRVRALSVRGASGYSDPASYTVPPTLNLTMISGTVADSGAPAKDSVKIKASYARVDAADTTALDPTTNGLFLQLGVPNAPVIVSIRGTDLANPTIDPRWKVKKTKKKGPVSATWKSAKGETPKTVIVVDLVKHTLTATVTGAQFGDAPTGAVRTLVATGADGGADSGEWKQKKTGVFVFVKPK